MSGHIIPLNKGQTVKSGLTHNFSNAALCADLLRLISIWYLVIQTIAPFTASAATIKVTKSGDDGSAGTLRQALASAASGDTIDASGITGTISVTNGELLVSNSVTIIGPGPSALNVGGNNAGDPIFMVQSTGIVSIAGLTITHFFFSPVNLGIVGRGIYNDHSTLVVSNCAVIGNSEGNGGGIYNDGYYGSASLSIYSSSVSSNYANYGAGIYNDSRLSSNTVVVIYSSTLSGNKALDGNGGGILNAGAYGSGLGGQIYILNSTISGNSAAFSGGGIFNDGEEGATTTEIQYSTFCSNSATYYGGAILNDAYIGSAILLIGNSIFSAGTSGGTLFIIQDTVFPSDIESFGHNISTDDGGGLLIAPGDQINTDPKLGSLAQNGGLTKTHALLTGSPAINSANPAYFPATDQRGYIRPIGSGPDIGAYEYGSYQPLLLKIAAMTNNQIKFNYTTTSSGSYVLQASTNLATWSGVTTNGPFASVTNISQTINLPGYLTRFFRLHIQ
jgi:hypothetical protein